MKRYRSCACGGGCVCSCARCSVSEAGAVAWLMVGLVADGGAGGEQSCAASVTAVSGSDHSSFPQLLKAFE